MWLHLLAGELAEGAEDTNPERSKMRILRTRKSLPIDSILKKRQSFKLERRKLRTLVS